LSAPLSVAGAAAAGADLAAAHALATRYDGHPENAAASVYGGLVASTLLDGAPAVESFPLDPDLVFVTVVPDRQLATEDARRALPGQVPHADARFNLGRLPLLLAGLADQARLRPAATEDRLHQPYRTALFPESALLMSALMDAGARAVCWSGAGPTILGIATASEAERVRAGGEAALRSLALAGRALTLTAAPGLSTAGAEPGPG
jgi:homoserine kinase